MARKRDNTTQSNTLNTSLTSLLRPARMVSPIKLTSTLPISRYDLATETVEVLADDGRTYHPLGPRRPQLKATGQVATIRRTYRNIKHMVAFESPYFVKRCIRRQTRKQVLHALNKQMKRGGGGGRYKRNYWSKIRC